jgi:TonB-linked SusC/RagA family outer membrane protein
MARMRGAGLVASLAVALGLLLPAQPAFAQTGTVEGQVTSASTGEPISAVQVSMVGTDIGTMTDLDGRFVLINVPAGQLTLRAVAIGFKVGLLQLTVQSGLMTTADIALSRSVLQLDAVVVTGTAGGARRREVGNSIDQISAADLADPPASIEQLLQGRAAGLTVTQSGGGSGSGGQIRLRGLVSVNQSNQPILYVDGVRVRSEGYRTNRPPVGFRGRSGNVQASPVNDINPDDIERIEVIKGSAATTLYGTEAAAGVIQIFTKKGREGAPTWNVQIDQGFAQVRPFGTERNPYMNFKPGEDTEFVIDDFGGGSCAVLEPKQDCSWLQNGYRQKYSGSVGGGVSGLGYFVSGTYQDYEGTLPNDTEWRLSTRGNFNFELLNNLKIDFNTAYSSWHIENTAAGNNAHGLTLNVFRAERNYIQSNDPRLLRELLNQEITTDVNRLVTGVTVTFTPWTWFTNRYTLGYDLAQQENRNLRPFGFTRAPAGIVSDEQITYQTLTSDYVGSVNFGLTDALRTTFSFGGQAITTREVRTTAYGEDFAGPGEPEVSDAASFIARENRLRVVNAGFFFQNMLDFKDKLFLTGGIRFDGNSAFGGNLGLEAYPKASLSYVISDEAFWSETLGEWKLRGAIGFSGRAPGAFDAIRTWESVAANFEPGFQPQNLGNPDVGPERTREIEFGVDGAFLNNRISAEFTWYHQRTSDALFDVRPLPSLGGSGGGGVGWGSQAANVGVLRNTGIELNLRAQVAEQRDWGVEIGGSIYTNHTEVLDLGDAVPFETFSLEQGGWVEEGFPALAARGIMLLNPDAIADPQTVADTVFGPTQPTFVFSQSIRIRLPKGILLSARGEYQGGAYLHDGMSFNALSRSVIWPTCLESGAYELIDAGQEDQLTARQRMECISGNTDDEYFWFKSDFWKLRDVTLTLPLTWAIPQSRNATLTFSAQNWIKWINSDMRILDPEMSSRNTVDEPVREIQEHVPAPAIFTASLRLSF